MTVFLAAVLNLVPYFIPVIMKLAEKEETNSEKRLHAIIEVMEETGCSESEARAGLEVALRSVKDTQKQNTGG